MSTTDLREIGVGMLGYAFMGKAHSNAYRKLAYMTWPPPLRPRLIAIFGRNREAVAEAARRYGYERWTTDWRDLFTDDAIGLFDNGGPNSLHAEPTIAAAEAGKHVLCEKPLGRTADESYEIWQVEPSATQARIDDAIAAAVEFEWRRHRTIEATRVTLGPQERAAMGAERDEGFDHVRRRAVETRLQVFRADGRARGFETVLVTEPDDPFLEWWCPPGHLLGWEHTFVHEIHHLLRAIADDTEVAPVWGDVRGRRSGRGGLRCDPALGGNRASGGDRLPLSAA